MMNDNKNEKTTRQRDFYVHRIRREDDENEKAKEKRTIISPHHGRQEVKIENFGVNKSTESYDFVRRGRIYVPHVEKVTEPLEKNDTNLKEDINENLEQSSNRYEEIRQARSNSVLIKPNSQRILSNREYDEYENIAKEINDQDLTIDFDDIFSSDIYEEPVAKPQSARKPSQAPSRTNVNFEPEVIKSAPVAKTAIKSKRSTKYIFPPIDLLEYGEEFGDDDRKEAEKMKQIINETFGECNIKAYVADYNFGATVIQFLIKTEKGYLVERINSYESNLRMNLAVEGIRIQTPIPGKPYVGIEVPKARDRRRKVYLRRLLENKSYRNTNMILPIALGQDSSGDYQYVDITEMPHSLIAGTTRSGKSVCINVFLISLLYRFSPKDLKLVLIDPKRVELSTYRDIPHLIMPVITEQKRFPGALNWVVEEMERRYELFESLDESNIIDVNYRLQEERKPKVPYILVIIDEFSDWIVGAGEEVENGLQRIAQKARAAGIHVMLAAQRPSKDVIKGSIKANFDTRIAFKVSSFEDSKVILGGSGAEKLEGYGDMLIKYAGTPEKRLQGAFVSSTDIKKVINYIRENNEVQYEITNEELDQISQNANIISNISSRANGGRNDDLFEEIAYYIVRNKNASMNAIQQVFNIAFNRIKAIMLVLEDMGVVNAGIRGREREVLVDEYQLTDILENE